MFLLRVKRDFLYRKFGMKENVYIIGSLNAGTPLFYKEKFARKLAFDHMIILVSGNYRIVSSKLGLCCCGSNNGTLKDTQKTNLIPFPMSQKLFRCFEL